VPQDRHRNDASSFQIGVSRALRARICGGDHRGRRGGRVPQCRCRSQGL